MDIIARRLSQDLPVQGLKPLVDNKPGAGGRIALEALKNSAADGKSWAVTPGSLLVLYPHVFKDMGMDALNDFLPVAAVGSSVYALAVGPLVPSSVKTVSEFTAWCKANPQQASYASSGNGSTQHLTGALFIKMAGIQMTHVPYRGSGPATADLLAGQVTVGFPGIAGMLQFIKTGKLRALGVSGGRRSAELADVPTIAEAGVPGYEMVSWFGMAAPKGLARDVQMRLHSDLLRVLKNPDFQKSMRAAGQEVAFQDTPEKFYDFMKIEAVKWARVVADSGARVE